MLASRTEHRFSCMGGPCRLVLDAEDEALTMRAIAATVSELDRLESKYSRYRGDSLISQLNAAAGSGRCCEPSGCTHDSENTCLPPAVTVMSAG